MSNVISERYAIIAIRQLELAQQTELVMLTCQRALQRARKLDPTIAERTSVLLAQHESDLAIKREICKNLLALTVD
jgi:hypothetical protein